MDEREDFDALAGARGVIYGVAISVVIYLVAIVGYYLFK